MMLAGFFAVALFLGLLIGDWLYFVRLTPDAIRYGCTVARSQDRFPDHTVASLRNWFPDDGVLRLGHGVAWLSTELSIIAIRPQYQLFSMTFRTAWPIKGLIHLTQEPQAVRALCIKRIPWSSAILTLLWFVLVTCGSLTFVVTYSMDGGFSSFSGVLMGSGIIGIALLVVAFGVVTVMVSYRLEDGRLRTVYDELRETLAGSARRDGAKQ